MCPHTEAIAQQISEMAIEAGVSNELIRYIRKQVFPVYAKNDKGHRLDHIQYVIRRSLSFMRQFEGLNADMVYTIAAYHDVAHHLDKDRHEALSAEAFDKDEAMEHFFTDEKRQIIKEAIEDHRASLEREPRSIYGKIVSSADRSTDVDGFFRRTHAYSRKHFPHYTKAQTFERCYQHMHEKYGNDGYAKSYVYDEDYLRFLETIRALLSDRDALRVKYSEIADAPDGADML